MWVFHKTVQNSVKMMNVNYGLSRKRIFEHSMPFCVGIRFHFDTRNFDMCAS